jgi:ribosome biogenesis GTPase / thiamine phosphate phosphatase
VDRLEGLRALGWGEPFESAFATFAEEGMTPARVGVEHRNRYVVMDGEEDLDARLSGRMRMQLQQTGDRPVVGDWVALRRADKGACTIQARLPRKSQFSRKVAGRAAEEQVMAANIDTVFLATALTDEVNPRRIERYLLLAWESGAKPVMLLTKSDLVKKSKPARAAVQKAAPGVPVHVVSGRTGAGLNALDKYLQPGTTIAVLGASGVGKSTLINGLLGEERLRTAPLRADGSGRHTTTHRELVRLPAGALVIDTPGLRELQLWEADVGLQEAFTDIEELAAHCRFKDCAHVSEPDCAVRLAVETGELPAERLDSYHGLKGELAHIEEKHDARTRALRSRLGRIADKLLKRRLEEKGQQ